MAKDEKPNVGGQEIDLTQLLNPDANPSGETVDLTDPDSLKKDEEKEEVVTTVEEKKEDKKEVKSPAVDKDTNIEGEACDHTW